MPILRHVVAWDPTQIPNILRSVGYSDPVHVVHADRKTGKTTELLKLAVVNHRDLRFAVVSPNKEMSRYAHQYFHESVYVHPEFGNRRHRSSPWPRFFSAQFLRTSLVTRERPPLPLYVDEWNLLSIEQQREILDAEVYGYKFVVAISS